MMEEILDGEIHVISKDYAAIAEKLNIDKELTIEDKLRIVKDNYVKKYAEYIYTNNKEFCLKLIEDEINIGRTGELNEEFQFIYRPPWFASILSDYATIALKFKRRENDNLGEER